jgi:hypothetical protein
MNYPPYPLSKRTQNIIFMFFVIAFFITAPLVTLYATGYRLDKKTFQITKTGVLSVDIIPSDAKVFIDTVLITEKLPLRRPQMTPGTYHLEIKKDGYLSWVEDIVIEKNKTTYIKEVELFLIQKPNLLMNDLNISEAYFSKNGNFALQKISQDHKNQYVLFDTQSKMSTPIETFDQNQNIDVLWSPKATFFAMTENLASSSNFILYDKENSTSTQKFSIQTPIQDTQWTGNIFNLYRDVLLLRTEGFDITLESDGTKKITTSSLKTALSYRDMSGDDWYLDTSQKYIKKNTDNSVALSVGQNKIEKIIDINNNRIIAKTSEGMIVIEQKDNQIKILPCTNYFFDSIRKEYIAWSKWELWTIYDNGQVALLNRMSDPIESVRPLDTSGELLIATNHKLLGFNPGYYVTQTLLDSVTAKSIAVDITKKTIFFFGDYDGKKGLYSLKY